MTSEQPKTGLFDQLYAGAKALFDEAKKPLIRKKIKRKLQAAWDDAEGKINESLVKIQKTREDFENYDVNKVLSEKAVIIQCKSLQEQITAEYLELFGKDMTVGDE